jgi:uncharacterized membrane protein
MNKTLLCAALAGIISIGATAAQADDNAGKEKCYGIAKAGKNDCATNDGSHSCAGQSTTDNSPNEWKFMSKGKCKEMGGSLKAGKEMMNQSGDK